METNPAPRTRVAALAVAVIVVLAFLAYYEIALRPGGNDLGTEVTALQQENQALQAQLASISNSSRSAEGAAALYSTSSASVVTVQGYELITQQTFFGPVASIESIQGSGFAVSYDAAPYIVTNYHVVDGASNITVTFSNGDSFPATVKGTDASRDLAVLNVTAPASEFHPLTLLGSPLAVTVGETVYAIGTPFGLSGSMTVGIVSQVGRTITESTTGVSIPNVIQFSAAINPGNSGGPLLDSSGEVIGITTAAVSSSQGLGFAIPASTISLELASLVTTGSYALHPYIGISGSVDMTYQLAQATGANVTYGVLIESVAASGPAASAGIRGGNRTVSIEGQSYTVGGDIIVSINGVRVVDMDSLSAYLEQYTVAGETVQLGVVRAGTLVTVSVQLGSVPTS